MNGPTARDLLTARLTPVRDTDRPPRLSAPRENIGETIYAVYHVPEEGRFDPANSEFLGLVTEYEIARHPTRVFADLLPRAPVPPASPDTTVANLRARFDAEHVSAIAVLDTNGSLMGAITPAAILDAVAQHAQAREHALLAQIDEIAYTIELADEKALAGHPLFVSERVRDIIGYRSQEFVDHPELWFNILHPEDISQVERQTALMIKRREPTLRLYRLRHKDTGEYRWMEDKVTPLFDADGALSGLVGVARDVTDRIETQQALAEHERMLDTLLQNLPGMVYRCANDPQWTMQFVSQNTLALTGYTAAELTGNRAIAYAELIHPEDRESVWADVQAAVAGRRAFLLRYRIRTKDGGEKWVWEQGRGVFNEQGELLALEGYITDVTARTLAEQELRAAEARERSLLEAVPDLLLRVSSDGTYLDFEPARDFPTYVPAEQFLGRKVADVLPPAVAQEHLALIRRALETHQVQISRYQLALGGEMRDYEARIVPSGANEVLAMVRDVTLERRTEEKVATLAGAIEQTADSIIVTNSEGVIEYVNPAFERTTGYTSAESVGHKPSLVKSGQHGEAFYKQLWATIRAGQVFRATFVNRRKNGTLYYEEKSITPLKSKEGQITHFVSAGKDITDHIAAQRALREAKEHAELLLASAAEAIFGIDTDGRCTFVNPSCLMLLGYAGKPYVVLGKNMHQLMHHSYADGRPYPEEVCPIYQAFHRGKAIHVEQDLFWRADGTSFPAEVWAHPIRRGDAVTGAVVSFLDISERQQQQDMLTRLGRILDESANEIYVFDAESLHFTQVNEGARRNVGYTMDELRALTPLDLKPEFTPESFAELIAPVRRGEEEAVEFLTSHRRKDGSLYPVEVRLQLSRAGGAPVFFAIIQDITERKQAEERLSYLAYYDTLTGLPNRALFYESLRQSMIEADRRDRLVAVVMLDLDRFKMINDTLGHHVGDALLKATAERLGEAVRPGDTVARFGGDEFAVALANVAHIDDVSHVAQRIMAQFQTPLSVAGHELHVTPSLGVTLFPFDDRDIDNLLRNADIAMYQAKEHGRNNFQFFTAELNRRAERRLTLENALRHALERAELYLEFQPQVELKTRRILGAEALLRWRQPSLGLVSPMEFIPVAEDTGLILPIGEWVLNEACAALARWRRAGHRQLQIAVNLSARQLQLQDLPTMVKRVLVAHRVPAAALELEITESTLLSDIEGALELFTTLGKRGVKLSLDDFGTGYSSLAYLKRFPLDTLKIDRSFVGDVVDDPEDAAIVRAIIAMAGSLEMRTVAEGIETRAQLDFMRRQGCDAAQGYYFSRPVPEDAFTAMLGHEPWRRASARTRTPKGRRRKSRR